MSDSIPVTLEIRTDMTIVEAARIEANSKLDPARKAELGQFMTPPSTATFMAGLFSPAVGSIRLLDAGAGVGSLSSAFLDRFANHDTHIEAWEIDSLMQRYLLKSLSSYRARRTNITSTVFDTDFIFDAVRNLKAGEGTRFTHAIQNPPYAKINSDSEHRRQLREVGVETVNLYTAFLALTVLLMETHGEIVAIIPRSFCNGTYYRPFRELLLEKCALRHLHLFESRKKAFEHDDVLQENIIIHLVKHGRQDTVTVTTSHGPDFNDLQQQKYPFTEIVKPQDREKFIHIPVPGNNATRTTSSLFSYSLDEIGLEVCTGPVVDFRLRSETRRDITQGAVPLLYAHHFNKGQLVWPKTDHKKPNAIKVSEISKRWLMPKGWYVLVKRFSTKEERRRIVAYVLDPTKLPGSMIGLENHWNVFHVRRGGLEPVVAHGLCVFLNSTLVDNHFRVFSGHTQVNATDLRNMRYPSLPEIRELGTTDRQPLLSQKTIDTLIEELENRRWRIGTDESLKQSPF